jgi:hypothetical protein
VTADQSLVKSPQLDPVVRRKRAKVKRVATETFGDLAVRAAKAKAYSVES